MSEQLRECLQAVVPKFADMKLMSLTTADGFPIYCDIQTKTEVDQETAAAVSSSLISLSNAAAKQLIGSTLESTVIETKDGNMFLCNTRYQDKACVFCVVTGKHGNIGHARYFTQQTAELLSNQ